jgi:hypothetical protein
MNNYYNNVIPANFGTPTLVSQENVGAHTFKPYPYTESDVHGGTSKKVSAQLPNQIGATSGTLTEPPVQHSKTYNIGEHEVLLTNNYNSNYNNNSYNIPKTYSETLTPLGTHQFRADVQYREEITPGRVEETMVKGPYGPNGEERVVQGQLKHPSVRRTYAYQPREMNVNVVGGNHSHDNYEHGW